MLANKTFHLNDGGEGDCLFLIHWHCFVGNTHFTWYLLGQKIINDPCPTSHVFVPCARMLLFWCWTLMIIWGEDRCIHASSARETLALILSTQRRHQWALTGRGRATSVISASKNNFKAYPGPIFSIEILYWNLIGALRGLEVWPDDGNGWNENVAKVSVVGGHEREARGPWR